MPLVLLITHMFTFAVANVTSPLQRQKDTATIKAGTTHTLHTHYAHPSLCNVILILLHSSCAILVLICILIPVPVRLGVANPLLT